MPLKLITAVIKPHRVEEVKKALINLDVKGMTVTEAQGFGRQRGHTETYGGNEYKVAFSPKFRLEIVVSDNDANKAIDAILGAARTGKIGDGKIWVSDVDRLATGLSSLHTAVGAHLKDIRGELANGVGNSNPGTPTSASGPPEGGRGGTGGETDGDLARRVRDLEGDVERLVDADGGAGVARRVAVLEDNHKTLERRTRRMERMVEDVRSAEDRRARADEAERMRELRLGAGRGLGGGSTSGGGPRRRRGSSSSSSSSEDGREWSSGKDGKVAGSGKDDPIAALAGASVSTGLHGGFG